ALLICAASLAPLRSPPSCRRPSPSDGRMVGCRRLKDESTASMGDDAAAGGETPAPGGKVGRFFILGALGSGGMGVVLSAYDPSLDRKLAVKVLRSERWGARSDEGQSRLQQEAQAMARVSHPNVATVYEVGTVGNQVFVAMELVEGTTLNAWL